MPIDSVGAGNEQCGQYDVNRSICVNAWEMKHPSPVSVSTVERALMDVVASATEKVTVIIEAAQGGT